MGTKLGSVAVYSWECIGLDADERQLAEEIVENGADALAKPVHQAEHPRKPGSKRHEEYDLYAAHDSHRWSPVTHYLEPYL
ncbi:MAG: hypothetical protein KDD51_01845 [Bdellovibrionales bacterium]|nr:hypothetical protein [Bdellovibrionales bacterium]